MNREELLEASSEEIAKEYLKGNTLVNEITLGLFKLQDYEWFSIYENNLLKIDCNCKVEPPIAGREGLLSHER